MPLINRYLGTAVVGGILLAAVYPLPSTANPNVDVAELVRQFNASQQLVNQPAPQMQVLVSLSMPPSSLLRLAKATRQANVALVLRGFVNNSFTATAAKLAQIDKHNLGNWQVDPRLFRELDIGAVPVFAISGDTGWEVVRGDVSLEYALKVLAARGGRAGATATQIAHRLAE